MDKLPGVGFIKVFPFSSDLWDVIPVDLQVE